MSRVAGMRLGVGAAAFAIASCATDPPILECAKDAPRAASRSRALVGESYGTQMKPIPLDSVLFSEQSLARAVALQRISASRTATGTVEVNAVLANCSGKPLALRMRSSFYDAQQRISEPISAWRTVHVTPGGLGTYTESSITREVSAYLIEVAGEAPGR